MPDTHDNPEWYESIGAPAAASIVEMVAALECDYDRLEELRDERDAHDDGPAAWAAENPDESEELTALESAAGECSDTDEARQRIEEDALSVEVRSGWHSPGDDAPAEEFCILLATGGPAVRIRGELNEYREPCRAWLEVQDWYKPWTQYHGIEQDALLAYAQCFYFGE
jgi:hypothetical protein